jgi:hypothetical protein
MAGSTNECGDAIVQCSMRTLSILFVFIAPAMAIEIELAGKSDREQQAREQLERVLAKYDTRKWTFTTRVRIEDRVIPHSHPVLTLSTGNLGRDEHMLSEFVHEQIHWHEEAKPKEREAAIKELQAAFPDLPLRPPEGARDRYSSYLHVIVCFLEYKALKELTGETTGRSVFEHWAGHHYKAIYRLVLEREHELLPIIRRNGLLIPNRDR